MEIGIPRVFSIITDMFYQPHNLGHGMKKGSANTGFAETAKAAAPEMCDDLNQLETCLDQLCAGFKRNGRRNSESNTRVFKDALQFCLNFLDHKWIPTRALIYKTVETHKDQFCQGEPLAVAEPVVQEVAAQQRNIFIVGVGALGILALRIASLHPSMRSASPALIEGVYMWMGLPGVDVMDFEGMYRRDHSDLL